MEREAVEICLRAISGCWVWAFYMVGNAMRYLMLLMLMSGCTMFSPLDQLHPEVPNEIPDELIELEVHIVNPITINYWCIVNGLNPILAILSPLTLFGCTNLHYPDEDGMYKCVIYQAYDADWIFEHEWQHCKGYMD